MARRSLTKPDRLCELLTEVRRRFQPAPLACFRGLIEEELLFSQAALGRGALDHEEAERLAVKVDRFMSHLPHEFGPRFLFDSAMIQAVGEEWTNESAYLHKIIYPMPSVEWGHSSVTYARHANSSVPVDFILIPGGPGLAGVDLLSYPFLFHELGHNVLFHHDQVFGPRFEPALDDHARSLRLRSISDRGAARQRAQANVEQLLRLWGPSNDHNNWSHEIAVDIIALWTCGPAYLAAIQDILEADSLDPYQIGQSHPPYDVRSNALLAASDELGWSYYTGGIRRQLDAWRVSESAGARTNSYINLANPDLTRACVNASLSACASLGLPLCTPEIVAELGERFENFASLDFGRELVLAAWLSRDRLGEDAYDAWERQAIEALFALVTT